MSYATSSGNVRGDAQQPALTRVCRQLRREALPLFYQLNHSRTFLHPVDYDGISTEAVNMWLKTIGPRNTRDIRSFTVHYSRGQLELRKVELGEVMAEEGLAMVAGMADCIDEWCDSWVPPDGCGGDWWWQSTS